MRKKTNHYDLDEHLCFEYSCKEKGIKNIKKKRDVMKNLLYPYNYVM